MKVAKGITRKAFKEKFGTKEQCLNYLVQKKWSFGFICRRCKNDRFLLLQFKIQIHYQIYFKNSLKGKVDWVGQVRGWKDEVYL